jgi:ribonuclease P protein component
MISRPYRFRGYNSLRFVYRQGKTVRTQALALRFVANDRQPRFRAAVVVSRKVHKSAVVRNRIRRRLYEVIRQTVSVDLPPHDLVFTVFSDRLTSIEPDQLRGMVEELLQKAGLR